MPSTTNGTSHDYDADLDTLYSWMPPQATPVTCPEALFSLTLKGTLDGIDTLLTVRGMTAGEFTRNLAEVRGLLDPVRPVAQRKGWCSKHQVAMQLNGKNGKQWWSHHTAEGWCQGK